MAVVQLYQADTSTLLSLLFADGGVRAGFPCPAQDTMLSSLDLNRTLVKHPTATFYARVVGDSMCDEGITEGDLLIVDRSLQAEHGDLAICALDGEFTLKRICVKKYGRIFLMPSNPRYMPIEVSRENDFEVWGVVIYTIKANRRNQPRTSKW